MTAVSNTLLTGKEDTETSGFGIDGEDCSIFL